MDSTKWRSQQHSPHLGVVERTVKTSENLMSDLLHPGCNKSKGETSFPPSILDEPFQGNRLPHEPGAGAFPWNLGCLEQTMASEL